MDVYLQGYDNMLQTFRANGISALSLPNGLRMDDTNIDRITEILGYPESRIVPFGAFPLLEMVGESRYARRVIVVDRDHLEAWPAYQELLQVFAERIRRDVFVINWHAHHNESYDSAEGRFDVVFWGASEETSDRTYRIVDGHPVPGGACDGCAIGSLGIPVTDALGYAVAELLENVLYIPFDAPHSASAVPAVQFILNRVVEMMANGYAELMDERNRAMEAASREIYPHMVLRRHEAELLVLRNQAIAYAEQERNSARELQEAVREHSVINKKLMALEASPMNTPESILREFDALRALPGVLYVAVTPETITVTTKHIISVPLSGGLRYDFGVYRIKFNDDQMPVVNNTTRTVDGYHHPHDMGHGRLCFGNISDGIARLCAVYQHSIATRMILQFLETANEEDSLGMRVHRWPIWKG